MLPGSQCFQAASSSRKLFASRQTVLPEGQCFQAAHVLYDCILVLYKYFFCAFYEIPCIIFLVLPNTMQVNEAPCFQAATAFRRPVLPGSFIHPGGLCIQEDNGFRQLMFCMNPICYCVNDDHFGSSPNTKLKPQCLNKTCIQFNTFFFCITPNARTVFIH